MHTSGFKIIFFKCRKSQILDSSVESNAAVAQNATTKEVTDKIIIVCQSNFFVSPFPILGSTILGPAVSKFK